MRPCQVALTSFTLLSVFACSGSKPSEPTSAVEPNSGPPVQAPPPVPDASVASPPADQVESFQQEEVVESIGLFVSTKGEPGAEGTRREPLPSIQEAIDRAKTLKKRVYVCEGLYTESLSLAESVHVVGGLDCSVPEWRLTPGKRARLEAPSSPAVTARDIKADTRLEGFDVLGPAVPRPSGTAVGLLAERAPALRLVHVSVAAGDGGNGADGAPGVELQQTGAINGQRALDGGRCVVIDDPMWLFKGDAACLRDNDGTFVASPGSPGGTSACAGAPGHDGEAGGAGGTGGLWSFRSVVGNYHFLAITRAVPGEPRSGDDGPAGADGASARDASFTREGYVPGSGTRGANGGPGRGGSGGAGTEPVPDKGDPQRDRWMGHGGAGGGAGGCPGLAGTPGAGGGASIGAWLVDSPITLDDTTILAGRGGSGGRGSLPSGPTPGGQPGSNPTGIPAGNAAPGGRGGTAGFSGHGAGGASTGIAHTGGAPKLANGSAARPGAGGAGVPEHTADVRNVGPMTIPASAEGRAVEMHAF